MRESVKSLEKTAWAPYETIEHPTREDWKKSYDALVALSRMNPKDGRYPNTLGYLCYYGRHTGERDYVEARRWFEKGKDLGMIESAYKLADMLLLGLGGRKNISKAIRYLDFLYSFCRDQFESGVDDGKFPDVALRIGRLFHQGPGVKKDDMTALGYLLEARYALKRRKEYGEYGDDTVEKNIQELIDACEKPEKKEQEAMFHGLGLGRVPQTLIMPDQMMTFTVGTDDQGISRLEFRRIRKDGGKPNRILWSIPPAMKVLMTEFVVLYAADIRWIWTKNPGEPVVCDRYEFDAEKDNHLFYLNDELQCRLMGGEYMLSMGEFVLTGLRDSMDCTGVIQ